MKFYKIRSNVQIIEFMERITVSGFGRDWCAVAKKMRRNFVPIGKSVGIKTIFYRFFSRNERIEIIVCS